MRIENEPKGKSYYDLLDLAFDVCDKFSLVLYKDDVTDALKALEVIKRLFPYFIERKEQQEWPGTMLMGGCVYVYYYSCEKGAKEILKEFSNCIFDWIPPDLPEDLSFYKDSEPWLINTAHECSCYLIPSEEENDRIVSINGLEIDD